MRPAPAVAELFIDLPRSGTAPGIARRGLRRMLADSCALELAADAELAASELITTIVAGAAGRMTMSASFEQDTGIVRVEVRDDDARPIGSGSPESSASAAVAMKVVSAVSTCWGVERQPGRAGTVMWFEIHQYRPTHRRSA
jgi:hypothetical protein